MKKLYAYLSVFFIAASLLSSCSQDDILPAAPEAEQSAMPLDINSQEGQALYANSYSKPVIITISLEEGSIEAGEPMLHLKDNYGNEGDAISFATEVEGRTTVVWRLAYGSEIDEITGIRAKDGQWNIFPWWQPFQMPSGSWIARTLEVEGEEAYWIDFVVNGKEYSVDPAFRSRVPSSN